MKTLLILVIIFLSFKKSLPNELIVTSNFSQTDLTKYCYYTIEDEDFTDASYYINNKYLFKNTTNNQLERFLPNRHYWFMLNLKTDTVLNHYLYTINYNRISDIEFYIYNKNELISRNVSGFLRNKKELDKHASRHTNTFKVDPGEKYTILIRACHSNGYDPYFKFSLDNALHYEKAFAISQAPLIMLKGAIFTLLLYILFAWSLTRYSNYIWIFCFCLFVGLFGFSIETHYIDLFFPNNPQLGWITISIYQRLATISFYILIINFFNLKRRLPYHYTAAKCIIALLVFLIFYVSLYAYYFGQFKFTNSISTFMLILHLLFFISIIRQLNDKINFSQRFMFLSIILFLIAATLLAIGIIIYQDHFVHIAPIIVQGFGSIISILFLLSLRLRLKRLEKERFLILNNHNKLLKGYSQEIQDEVRKKTDELKKNKEKLIQRNVRIKVLLDDLNHRVKNNLQLLYSIISIVNLEKKSFKYTIYDIQSRIKSMIIVHRLLDFNDKESIDIVELINQISENLAMLYDPNNFIEIKTSIKLYEDLNFNSKYSIPLGLILNELFTNSYKYAFNTNSETTPTIFINFYNDEDKLCLEYFDNGAKTNIQHADGDGLSLIKDLTRQLRGQVFINNYYFIFHLPKPICQSES